jgi:parallel beta-helix repeat protein
VNQGSGIALNGVTGTQVTSCIFEGVGAALQESDTSSGTTLSGCQILDWGRVGLFLNGGDNIQSTNFNQHDPNTADQVTSHGIYIHSGANNVTVQGCSFSGVRYYGIQLYGQSGGTTINNILISGNQFSDDAQDIAVETAGPVISGITITGNSFYRTHGNAVTLKEGTGIHIDSNQFYDMANGAVVLGNWAPYDTGASLSGVTVNNNTYQISSGTAGRIFVATGANGSLSNVTFQGNTASGFHEVGTYQMGAINIDQVSGATVSGNTLTMASGAGAGNTCAGVWATNSSGVQITGNTVNGTSTRFAYGVYAGGLSSASSIANNNLCHCLLAGGGASTSGNVVTQ